MLFTTQTTTLLQIFCKNILNYKNINKSIIHPDEHFERNSSAWLARISESNSACSNLQSLSKPSRYFQCIFRSLVQSHLGICRSKGRRFPERLRPVIFLNYGNRHCHEMVGCYEERAFMFRRIKLNRFIDL